MNFYSLVVIVSLLPSLWPPCVAHADILFYACGFFFVLFFLACPQRSEIGYFHIHTSTYGGPLVQHELPVFTFKVGIPTLKVGIQSYKVGMLIFKVGIQSLKVGIPTL